MCGLLASDWRVNPWHMMHVPYAAQTPTRDRNLINQGSTHIKCHEVRFRASSTPLAIATFWPIPSRHKLARELEYVPVWKFALEAAHSLTRRTWAKETVV